MAKWSAAKTTAVWGFAGVLVTAAVAVIVPMVNSEDPKPTAGVVVAGVSLSAPVTSFGVRCPITLRFEGKIDIESGTGQVVYRWLHSDGLNQATVAGDRQHAAASGPGTIAVTDEWTANIPEGDIARTTTLEILEPRNVRSDPVLISGVCDAGLPDGPSAPPPQVPGGPPG